MSEIRKSSLRWIGTAFVMLLLFYVLSSGPMQTVAFRRHITSTATSSGGSGNVGIEISYFDDQGAWWPKVYAPLTRATYTPIVGDLLIEYWMLFPIRETRD